MARERQARPLVSIVLPAFNEAAELAENVEIICTYLRTLEEQYRFEIIIVNDGSRDDTAEIAEGLRGVYSNCASCIIRPTSGLDRRSRPPLPRATGSTSSRWTST